MAEKYIHKQHQKVGKILSAVVVRVGRQFHSSQTASKMDDEATTKSPSVPSNGEAAKVVFGIYELN